MKYKINNEKIEYLKMVQEVIERMSTISSVFKGFSITVVIALITIIEKIFLSKIWILWIFLVPLFVLMFLDVYYLSLERKYRKLYEEIRTDIHDIDFSLEIPKNNDKYKINFLDCLKSKSILFFHLLIIIMYLIVCIFIK